MKKLVILLIPVLIILGGVGLKYSGVFSNSVSEQEAGIGKEIDSYKGVPVYFNGTRYSESHGKNYSSDGYYYGQKWQCVEYIKRFYYDALGHKMQNVYGNAKDFFNPAISQGEINPERGLIQFKNGEDMLPREDDLIVFTDTKYGHVAIVTKVTEEYVEIIQQNILERTRDRLKITKENGKYIIGDSRKPAGWLRKQ